MGRCGGSVWAGIRLVAPLLIHSASPSADAVCATPSAPLQNRKLSLGMKPSYFGEEKTGTHSCCALLHSWAYVSRLLCLGSP